MQPFRDKTRLTRLLILLELASARHARLAPLAKRLAITVQAVSLHVRALRKAGLLEERGGAYAPTPRGMQSLQEGLEELRAFVVASLQRVNVVRTTVAVAATPLREGERAGLFMEGGVLKAYARKPSPSSGAAEHAARTGEVVRLRELEGVVAHTPGRITVAALPDDGPPRRLDALLKEARGSRTGALDLPGLAALHAIGVKPDFEFAPVEAAIHACQRGLDVLLVGLPGEAARAAAAIDAENGRTGYRLAYEVRQA